MELPVDSLRIICVFSGNTLELSSTCRHLCASLSDFVHLSLSESTSEKITLDSNFRESLGRRLNFGNIHLNLKYVDSALLKGLCRFQLSIDFGDVKTVNSILIEDLSASPKLVMKFSKLDSLNGFSVLKNLKELNLSGCRKIADLTPISCLVDLEVLKIPSTSVIDLSPLANLRNLKYLDAGASKADFSSLFISNKLAQGSSQHKLGTYAPLSGLTHLSLCKSDLRNIPNELSLLVNLERLEISYTKIGDLSPLRGLQNLEYLNCEGIRELTDLTPLRKVTSLEYIQVSKTRVTDLSPLSSLSSLREIHANNNSVHKIAGLGDCDSLEILSIRDSSVLTCIKEVLRPSSLRSLDISSTGVTSLLPLWNYSDLEILRIGYTKITDIFGIYIHRSLVELDLSGTRVSDISQLNSLKTLEVLILVNCLLISDIRSVFKLTRCNLKNLQLGNMEISSLYGIEALTSLVELHINGTRVSDVSILKSLTNLEVLVLNECKRFSDITSVGMLTQLKLLAISGTPVNDLSPVKNLLNLNRLEFCYTEISNIGPVENLKQLTCLKCSNTSVADIRPIRELNLLEVLNCRDCKFLTDLTPALKLPRLKYFDCSGCPVPEDISCLGIVCSKKRRKII